MKDNRTIEQKLAAVEASMIMAGYDMSEEDREQSRRILRGETTADESILEILKNAGYDDSEIADRIRNRIAKKYES